MTHSSCWSRPLASGQVKMRHTWPERDLVGDQGQLEQDRLVDRLQRVDQHRDDAQQTEERGRADIERADAEPRDRSVPVGWVWSRQIDRPRTKPYRGSQYERPSLDIAIASKLMVQRPPTGTIPDTPGSYQFKDALGRVIYVGKASSLRQRLSNYFQDPRNMHPRTAQMVATAESVEWIEVRNEVEALMLEYSLIKQHRPRFNIRLRDDKSYPFLAVTLDEQFPRALVMRGRKRKGTKYFGPYAHAYAIRDTLDLLLRSFPIRTCSPGKFNEHQRLGSAVPAVPHREVQRSVRRRDRRGRLPRSWSTSCATSSRATPTTIVKRLDAEMRAAAERPGVRACRARARPADSRAPGDREAADGCRAQRRHRCHRSRRRRSRSRSADLLRPQGSGGRPQGLRASTRSRTSAPAAWSTESSRSCTATSLRSACPSRCSSRSSRRPGDVRGVADACSAGRGCRSACRCAATSATCTRP